MTYDERQVRELWEKQLEREIDDDEFAVMRAVYHSFGDGTSSVGEPVEFDRPSTALNALEEIQLARRDLLTEDATARTRRQRAVSLEPPRGWQAFQEQQFAARFEAGARRVRRLFGLSEPATREEVGGLLSAAESEQEWPTEPCLVTYIEVPFYEEGLPGGWIEPVFVYPAIGSSHGWDNPARRLYWLYQLVEDMGDEVGITPLSGVYYVLCGIIPRFPWVKAWHYPRLGPITGVGLRVSSLAVRPEEVAEAYEQARAECFEPDEEAEEHGSMPLFAPAPIFERVPAAAEELVAFCEKHLAGGLTWDEIRRAWNEEHPAREYKSGDVLGRTYRRYTGKQPKRGRAS